MSFFKKPSELSVTKTIKVLIYGQPGLGKSTLALSAPSPVLLDFDGGIQRVNGAFQCPTLQVHSWDEVIEAMKEDLTEFKSIVIDTAGKMLDFMSTYIIKNDSKMAMRDGSLSLKGYGARKVMFINFLSQCSILGKNLIFVAHEREEKDGETRIVRPEIGGSSAGDLIKELDLVGYMQAIGSDRTISWSPTEKFYAKNTCNLPSVMEIPTILDRSGKPTAKNDFITTRIITPYINMLQVKKEEQEKYNSVILDIKEVIDVQITDAQSANDFISHIDDFKHVGSSKMKASMMLSAKAKELGLIFDRETKKYSDATA